MKFTVIIFVTAVFRLSLVFQAKRIYAKIGVVD